MGNFINLTDSPRVSGGRGRGKASTLLAFLPSAAALSITLSRRVEEHRGQARELVSPQLFTANLFSSRLETISLKIFRFYSLSTTRSITRIIQTDASCLHLSDFSKSVHDSNEPPRHVYLLSRIALSYCEIIKFTFSITKEKEEQETTTRPSFVIVVVVVRSLHDKKRNCLVENFVEGISFRAEAGNDVVSQGGAGGENARVDNVKMARDFSFLVVTLNISPANGEDTTSIVPSRETVSCRTRN